MTQQLVVGDLRAELGFDGVLFETGTRNARNALRSTERDFQRSGRSIAKSATGIESAVSGVKNTLGGFGAAVGVASVGAAALSFLKLADQSKSMTAQLKLATAQSGSFAQAQDDVRRIANDTRNGLEATTALYGNFVRASQQVGRSQDDAARATETFSKALKIGGASSEEASSATLQFGQALASGVLRGDEFNSIMEASPRIARLLADSLGVPVGALRGMAEQGELTADKLYAALTDTKFTAGIDREFRDLPVTFGEAMTQVHDAAVLTFGAFDRGGDFSNMIVSFISDGADGFGSLERSAEDFGITVRSEIDGVVSAFHPFGDAITGLFGDLMQFDGFFADTLGDIDSLIDKINWMRSHTLFGEPVGQQFAPSNLRKNYVTARDESAASRRFKLDADKLNDNFGFGAGPISMADLSIGKKFATPARQASPAASGKKKKTSAADLLAQSMGYANNEAYRTAILKAKEDAENAARQMNPFPGIQAGSEGFAKGLLEVDHNLDALQADITATFGPMQQYLWDLQIESMHTGEAMETAFAGGLDSLGDGLADVVAGTRSLGDVFHNVTQQIIADLARIAIRQAIVKPLGNALFGGGGGGLSSLASLFGGNPIGSTSSAVSAMAGLPGFKEGGSFTVDGMAGIDRNVVSFRATRGEVVDIRKPGQDRGTGGDSYHFEGNLLTPEWWAMIQAGLDSAAARGAAGGATIAQNNAVRRAGRRINR